MSGQNRAPEATNWRLWFAGAGLLALVLGVRLPFTDSGTPMRGYWPLMVLGGALVLRVVWQTRPHRWAAHRRGPLRHVNGAVSEMRMVGPRGSAVTMRRWSERSRRNEGLASWWSI